MKFPKGAKVQTTTIGQAQKQEELGERRKKAEKGEKYGKMKESRRGKQKRDSEEYLEPPASLKTQKIVSENYIDTVVNMWRQFLQPHTHICTYF